MASAFVITSFFPTCDTFVSLQFLTAMVNNATSTSLRRSMMAEAARPNRTKLDWILQKVRQDTLRELVLDHCLFAHVEDDRHDAERTPTTSSTSASSSSSSAGNNDESPRRPGAAIQNDDDDDDDGILLSNAQADPSLELLLESLKGNTSIQSLVLSVVAPPFKKDVVVDDVTSSSPVDIWQVALSLPSLVEIHLYDEAAAPSHAAAVLRHLLHQRRARTPPLRVVTLTRVPLDSNKDVQVLAQSLALHASSLTQVRLLDLGTRCLGPGAKHSSRMDAPSAPPSLSLDPLFDVLSSLPNLETLDVTGATTEQGGTCRRRQRLEDQTLRHLFSNPSLQDVSLWHLNLDAGHIRNLAPVLQVHPNLTFLSLRNNPFLDWDCLERNMLQWNATLLHLYGDLPSDPSVTARLELWLDLNRRGRERAWLMPKDWIPFVAKIGATRDRSNSCSSSSSTDAAGRLYAFLRSNPSPLLIRRNR